MASSDLLLAAKIVTQEEQPSFVSIAPAGSSVGAMAGVTERGPFVPKFATSFDEWAGIYGGFIAQSDMAIAVQAAFRNGLTALWTQRVAHYTDILDPNTLTALAGSLDLQDRGGSPGPAVLDSAAGPFDLEPGEILEVNIDGAGADSLTFAATAATAASGNAEPYALINGDNLIYQVTMPGSAVLSEKRTITFDGADPLIANIGAVTAQEIVNVINRDGIGIKAVLTAGPSFEIQSDKRGAGAQIVIDPASTSIGAGALNIASGTATGTGNVSDVDSVTSQEIVNLLTALPLSSGTATLVGNVVRLQSTGVNVGATVVVTANTTALGIFAGTLPITQTGTAAAVANTLKLTAKDPGAFISNYSVSIEAATSGDNDRFNLRLKKGSSTVEAWPNLSMDPADPRYAEDFITANSAFLDALDLNSPAASPSNIPAIGNFNGWTGQDDGLTGLVDADFIGSEAGQTGMYAFDKIQDITILAIPGRATAAVHSAMLTYCEVQRSKGCFAILDTPEGLDAQGVKTYVETTASLLGASEFGAFYWPRVKIVNPSTAVFGTTADGNIVVPPSGHIMGAYGRLDSQLGGIHKAPAGTVNGRLFGVVGFETDDTLDERKRDVVYPSRINPITTFPGASPHIDGNRTLKADGNFPTVGERRGVIFIEKSIKEGIVFAKHLPNNFKLRDIVNNIITAFLLSQFEVDAFRGRTPAESFFVDTSDQLNPPELEFAGVMKIRIGLATNKPLDFGIVLVTQDTRAIEERLASA